MKVSEPDIMHHLIEAPPMSSDPHVNDNWEAGDARLIIVAGRYVDHAGTSRSAQANVS